MEKKIGDQSAHNSKMTAKDFVFAAVFGVLIFLVFMVFSMLLMINVNFVWFTHGIAAIPAGIIWAYLISKVNKRGLIITMGIIVGIVGFLMGMFWSAPVGIIVGAILAELIAGNPSTRTAKKLALAFAVFVFCFWLGHISLIFINAESYIQMIINAGMSREYAQGLVDFVYSPLCVLAGIAALVGGFFGSLLGNKVFKKHFEKISA